MINIHTGGKDNFLINFGTMKPLGHVDFYLNGAGPQPQCGVREELADLLNPFAINFDDFRNVTQRINGLSEAVSTAEGK